MLDAITGAIQHNPLARAYELNAAVRRKEHDMKMGKEQLGDSTEHSVIGRATRRVLKRQRETEKKEAKREAKGRDEDATSAQLARIKDNAVAECTKRLFTDEGERIHEYVALTAELEKHPDLAKHWKGNLAKLRKPYSSFVGRKDFCEVLGHCEGENRTGLSRIALRKGLPIINMRKGKCQDYQELYNLEKKVMEKLSEPTDDQKDAGGGRRRRTRRSRTRRSRTRRSRTRRSRTRRPKNKRKSRRRRK